MKNGLTLITKWKKKQIKNGLTLTIIFELRVEIMEKALEMSPS